MRDGTLMPMLREDRQVHSSVLMSIHQLKRWGIDLGLDILEHPVVTVPAPLLNTSFERPFIDVACPVLGQGEIPAAGAADVNWRSEAGCLQSVSSALGDNGGVE